VQRGHLLAVVIEDEEEELSQSIAEEEA